MPNMDGFQLTKTIRSDPYFNDLPVIALTTLAAEENVARGLAVGVNEYLIKLDKERLMTSVHHYMKQRH
jgi:two-component system chemotaxis sensor kinase CheA